MSRAIEPFDFGCMVSICFSSFVIVTYLWNRERRRHPATLIAARSLCDLCLGIISLVSSLQAERDCSTYGGHVSAFLIEFFVIASESLLACACLDVIIHAGDPFTDYRANISVYFASVLAISLIFAIGLVQNADDHIGESFLPLCWTKYAGGRVISDLNVSMSVFFYIPWSLIFLLSISALARACVMLGDGGVEGAGGPARSSALRDTRRVIFAHAAYWGAVLVFFAPMTNATDNDAEIPHGLVSSIVKFLSGARAIENAMVWMPSLSATKPSRRHLGGDADLSPVLNTELQRDVLVAAVVGMTTLLREEPLIESDENTSARQDLSTTVRLGTWRQEPPRSTAQISMPDSESLTSPLMEASVVDASIIEDARRRRRNKELAFLVLSVGPILLACLSAGLAAIIDRDEPTYLCIVFFGAFLAILLVLSISWQLALNEIQRFTVADFSVLHSDEFRKLRNIWNISADAISISLLEAIKKEARFSISAGRSGAFMFFSPDNRFVIKTIKRQERNTLCNVILPRLLEYCEANAEGQFISLARVYACFEMRCFGRNISLVVMENVTGNLGAGDTKYDLKGSWYARSTERPKNGKVYICDACGRPFVQGSSTQKSCLLSRNGHIPKRLLKDNDFRERVLGRATRIQELKEQIRKDVGFLASCGVMDYSLLLCVRRRVMHLSVSRRDSGRDWFPSNRLLLAALVEGPSAFQFGIIDWFTQYDNTKRLEKFIKMNIFCRRERDVNGFVGVSAVDPMEYRDRFLSRVVDVAFPLLFNVVQLVDSSRDGIVDEESGLVCTTLDVSGVDTFGRLCQFVSQSSGSAFDPKKDQLICYKDGTPDTNVEDFVPFELNETSFSRFKEIAARTELTTLFVARDGQVPDDLTLSMPTPASILLSLS